MDQHIGSGLGDKAHGSGITVRRETNSCCKAAAVSFEEIYFAAENRKAVASDLA
jgi:hypothetical protein